MGLTPAVVEPPLLLAETLPVFEENLWERPVSGTGEAGAVDEFFPDGIALALDSPDPRIIAALDVAGFVADLAGDLGEESGAAGDVAERFEDADPVEDVFATLGRFLVEARDLGGGDEEVRSLTGERLEGGER